MSHTHKRQLIWLFILFPVFFSCKKEFHNDITGNTTDPRSVTPYLFDWTSADYMPVPSSYSGPTIYVPWANGSVKGFSSDIWYDFQPSAGWQMVYNVFDPTKATLPANPFFVLYNRYRGLLRIYIYVTNSGFQNSDYLTSGLNLGPNSISSSMLNFIGQDVIDVTAPQTQITKIEPTQIATNTWYASQYEIAYDPNVTSHAYTDIGLNWTLKWTNITKVNMGGYEVGTLTGSITTQGSAGFDLSGLTSNAATGVLEGTGMAIINNNKGTGTDPGVGNKLGLPSFVFDALNTGLSSGLSGVVKNIFNGIFGGSSGGSTQSVNLELNTKITLTGTTSGTGALIPDPGLGLGVPGTNNSQSAPGLVPNSAVPVMGVFNLSAKPTIKVKKTVTTVPPASPENTTCRYDFTLDKTSFQEIWNTTGLNGATIQNLKEEMVYFDDNFGLDPSDPNQIISGTQETIGNHNAYTDIYYIQFMHMGSPTLVKTMGLRVSFQVVPPTDPTHPILIIKTFKANVVNQ